MHAAILVELESFFVLFYLAKERIYEEISSSITDYEYELYCK